MSEPTYHADDDETLSEAIINALSAVRNNTARNAQPLYESIDPEAVDNLFSGRSTRWRIAFDHAGYRITADSTGEIRLEDAE